MDTNKRSGRTSRKLVFGLVVSIVFGAFIFAFATVSKRPKHQAPSPSTDSSVKVDTGIFNAKKITYLTDAEKDYFAAEQRLPELSSDDSQSLARRLGNESSRAADSKDFETARKYRAIIHIIRKQDFEAFPDDFLKTASFAISITGLGQLEKEAGNYEIARKHLDESMEFLKQNKAGAPHRSLWLQLMMSRHRDLGDLEMQLKQYEAAKHHYEEFLEFVIKNPSHEDYFYNHAEGYFLLAGLNFEQKLWPEAAQDYESSIKLLEKLIKNRLSEGNPRDELLISQRLAYSYQQYGYTAYVQSDNEAALLRHMEAIKARKNALKSERSGISEELDLAATYYYAARQTTGKDNEFYLSALEILERLKKTQDLPKTYEKIIEDIDSITSR